MELNISDRLNPSCEILGLIYLVKNYDSLMEEFLKNLNESGINGNLFIKKNFKILDKYIKEFKKNMIMEEENELFLCKEDDNFSLFFLIVGVFINYDGNMEFLHKASDNEIRKLILEVYFEIKEVYQEDLESASLKDILSFIEKQELSNENKWQFMKMLNNPKDTIDSIIKVIDNNKHAYQEAYNSIEKQLINSIEKFKKYISSGECEAVNNLIGGETKFKVVPSLAFGMAIFELVDTVFVGVLIENLYKEQIKAMGNKGDLVLKLKALSDNSKLETIALLKKGPKYSSEIAESLNLTSATVSYHMSTLLEIGLVSVEKRQGKVYYNLNNVGIQKFIDDLNNTLL